jgi:hypothetical protein
LHAATLFYKVRKKACIFLLTNETLSKLSIRFHRLSRALLGNISIKPHW